MSGLLRFTLALLAGLLFGAGLALSQMINPAVVLAFLDVAQIPAGLWNPSLALVMLAAVGVTWLGYRLAFRRAGPLAAPVFQVPTARTIDARLIGGAVLFGLGWGLCGYCPGPAIAGLSLGVLKTWIFVTAMATGMALHHVWTGRVGARPPQGAALQK